MNMLCLSGGESLFGSSSLGASLYLTASCIPQTPERGGLHRALITLSVRRALSQGEVLGGEGACADNECRGPAPGHGACPLSPSQEG